MRLVTTCKTTESATQMRRLLEERGIQTSIVVDPLESRFPALCSLQGVGIFVRDGQESQALQILGGAERKAS